jgi:hypothetical protein
VPKHDEIRHQKISAALESTKSRNFQRSKGRRVYMRKAKRKNIGVRAAKLLSLPSMALLGVCANKCVAVT